MNQQEEITSAVSLISNHFSIAEDELQLHNSNMQELEDKLTKIITTLLNQDMERLLHAFYRIDLDELTFKKVITQESPENIGAKLAQEVIKRELQKVRTRERYKNY